MIIVWKKHNNIKKSIFSLEPLQKSYLYNTWESSLIFMSLEKNLLRIKTKPIVKKNKINIGVEIKIHLGM